MQSARQHARSLHGLFFTLAGSVLALALWPNGGTNLLGLCGRMLARVLGAAFGHGAWLLPLFLLTYARADLFGRSARPPRLIMCGSMAVVCTALHLVRGAGGRLGAILGEPLLLLLGFGAYFACGAVLLAALARWTSLSIVGHLGRALDNARLRLAAAWRAATAREIKHHASVRAAPLATIERTARVHRTVPSFDQTVRAPAIVGASEEPPIATLLEVLPVGADSDPAPRHSASAAPASMGESLAESMPPASAPSPTLEPYRKPTPALLVTAPLRQRSFDERVFKSTSLKIEQRLEGYGIEGRMDAFVPGPVVTMYEFEPKPGTKLSKIKNLEAELSMALETAVRVVAPLPGTARVGIEVPHCETEREAVYLRELVEDERWDKFAAPLPLALGKDSSGRPVFCDLAAAPHLLVAGATGSGKSSGLSVMLTSLLLKCSPEELRLLLIDPKVVELASFADIPHLLAPVVTEMHEAVNALRWTVGEMERRYRLLADAGVRNLEAYNARAGVDPLAHIVVVVDEFADLMMANNKAGDVENAIARLAQKARAAGIHLVIATQRPSVDVITGLIKANLPSRIAYRVPQWVDSKVILDRRGAEHLLGRGDMLCLLPGCLDLIRVHGAYVGDDEVKMICDDLRSQRPPDYDHRILAALAGTESAVDNSVSGNIDPLYHRAVELVVGARSCSTSALQRELNVGYNRAAKLVARMEESGVVGPPVRAGGKREVLLGESVC